MKPLKFLAILSALLAFNSLPAQVSKDAVVQIEVSIGTSPRSLILNWPVDARATVYNVYRRLKGAKGWGTAKRLAATASQYIDSTISIGTIYEYRVTKTLKIGTATATAIGYTESGIEIPPVGDRGKLILLVDKTYVGDLANELYRLEQDLWNDGWKVIRHDVGRTDLVPDVKAIVANDYNSDPDNTKALFIFGHVPVPYSGFLNPDGHPDHFGAWPADVYYGEFDSGDWPDAETLYHDSLNIYQSGPTTFDTALVRVLNRNKTGDGKFDYTQLPGPIYLMIGRVDLFNMPSFTKSEKELLRQYLNKDHAFRTGTLSVPPRALLEDDFGYFGGEAFASSGWRNLTPLVGADSIQEFDPSSGDWIPVISTKPFLWAYGCGGGWDQGAGGAGSTGEFANSGEEAIFTMLFGSYFGDWGTTDNFLRAPLCTSYGLSCAWSGRPYWQFFPMGLGEPLGYCAQLTQNNTGDYTYNYAANWVHIDLMGDPTLVMRPIPPPTALSVATNADHNIVTLNWLPSSDQTILGYDIYRSKSPTGTYVLLNTSPVVGTTYADKDPLIDTNAYIVRAVKLEGGSLFSGNVTRNPSGSYYNLSSGTRSWLAGLVKNGVATASSEQDRMQVMPTLQGFEIILHKAYSSLARLEICDVSGKIVRTLDNRSLSEGVYRYDWQTSSVPTGVYFVRAIGMHEPLVEKIFVMR